MARSLDLDELVEHWTLLDDERELIAGKRGSTRLGFALLLKFYTQVGRFPRGRGELPGEAVEFVARQVGVEPAELGLYEWTGRTIEYHRAQIRSHLGFRECTVADAEQLTQWLAAARCRGRCRPSGLSTVWPASSPPPGAPGLITTGADAEPGDRAMAPVPTLPKYTRFEAAARHAAYR